MLSCRDMAPWLSIHSPTASRGGGGAVRHQRGNAFPTPAGRLYGFIQTGAFYNLEAPYNNPRAKGASNLSPLRTFGPAGRQPSSHKGACSYGASHQRGNAGVVHEVYDSLFFSSNFLFPLEGKCHVVAKGCTRVSIPMKLTIVLLGRALADSRILCRMRASEGGKAIP